MSNPIDFSELHFVRARIGDKAFYCRGADIILGFETYADEAIFESSHDYTFAPIDQFYPAFSEDFEVFAYKTGAIIVFKSDAYDGSIYLALPQWCFSENNLRSVANELSCGWGIHDEKIITFG